MNAWQADRTNRFSGDEVTPRQYAHPNIFFDDRWSGDHGIGRFAREVNQRIGLHPLDIGGAPWSPLDPLRLTLAMLRLPRDTCVFSPGYNAPLVPVRPYLFVLHDLNHLDRPENSSLAKRLYYRLVIRRACRFAHRVLTVSEFSRRRIVEWSGLPGERVVNVGNGVDEAFNPQVVPQKFPVRYLFCVGSRKAHKNEGRLLEAFARARIDTDIHLLLTGDADRPTAALCEKLGLAARVDFIGRVAEEDLPRWYRGAIALAFPSLYEGFGLPVVEAMACGTPVLTSATTALPEVAGDAALLVDPLSVDEIAAGIERLCDDASLREELRRRGLERARRFRWEDVATRVESVLAGMERSVAGAK